jgi:acetyl esterase/lipase
MVHGGGWQGGSRNSFRHWGPFLARQGYVAFASTYRLSTHGNPSYPGCVQDVRAALQYLRRNADTYRLDPSRIAAMGHSAGGHLVAMLGLTNANERFQPSSEGNPNANQDGTIKVIIPLAGVFDLLAQWEYDQLIRPREQVTEQLLGGSPMTARERFYDASPLYHASDQNAANTAWLVSWGTRDDVVEPKQSVVFAEHLKRANAVVRTAPIEGAGHFWVSETNVDTPGVYANQFAPRLLGFLSTYL